MRFEKRHPAVNAYLSELGKKGGPARAKALSKRRRKQIAQSGGKARAAKMTPEERSAAARKAIRARWRKAKNKPASE